MPFPEVQSQFRRLSKTRAILSPPRVWSNFPPHSVILASVQGPLTTPSSLCCPNPQPQGSAWLVEEVLGFQLLFALMPGASAAAPESWPLIPTSSASPEELCPGTVASCTLYTAGS